MISSEELTLDNIGRRDFVLYQQKKGFRFGTDSVLMAWFAASFARRDKEGGYRKTSYLELGSGCGGAAMCVAARLANCEIDCVEIMDSSCEVLRRNITANHVEDRVRAYNCDARDLPIEIRQKQYDVVFANPPFFSSAKGDRTDPYRSSEEKLNARFEENGTVEDFISVMKARVIPSSGHVVMVMKADRMAEVTSLMEKYNIKPVRLMCIHPMADRECTSVLIAGRTGSSGSQLRILPPLILDSERVTEIYEGEHKDCFIW